MGYAISFIVQPVLHYGAYRTRSKAAVWLTSLTTLLSLTGSTGPFHYLMASVLTSASDNVELAYISSVTWNWINARCLSFCLDKLNEEESDVSALEEVLDMVAYTLYLPTAVSGPIIVYRKYRRGVS